MEKNTINILVHETSNLHAYYERLFHILGRNKDQSPTKKKFFTKFEEYQPKLHKGWQNLISPLNINPIVKEETESYLLHSLSSIGHLLKANLLVHESIQPLVSLLNLYYQMAYDFHVLLDCENKLKIQLPRVHTLSVHHPEENDLIQIPKFYLIKQDIEEASKDCDEFCSLFQKREDKYQSLIKEGHQYIYDKDYKEALNSFIKASKIKLTAQSLNLVAWAYGLIGNLSEAKKYCLEAIKLDPDFGDPYNDMGSYLLIEGNLKECMKWFQSAKKAKYYLHREFPYINTGKAYLLQKNHEAALKEFSAAQKFVPYQKELINMIEKLKNIVAGNSHQ